MSRSVADIRNVVLVGHGGTGKTSIVDGLAHLMGVTARPGSVDQGSSVSDFEQEELERKHSFRAAVIHGTYQKRDLNIIGAVVKELPNQIDQTQGSRIVLQNCFSVENGSQKFSLCAPSYEELQDWLDVLSQNVSHTQEDADGTQRDRKMTDILFELEGLMGKCSPEGEIDSSLQAYGVLALREWLAIRTMALDLKSSLNMGLSCSMPVLLAKSTTYDQPI